MSMFNPLPDRQPDPISFGELVGISVEQPSAPYAIPSVGWDQPLAISLTMKLATESLVPSVKGMFPRARQFFQQLERELGSVSIPGSAVPLAVRRMLHFPEVAEARVGYTLMGHNGNGLGSAELARDFIDFVARRPEVRAVLAMEPDALYLLPHIGTDRGSDVLANIVKDDLIEFTRWCTTIYGFDSRIVHPVSIPHAWGGPELGWRRRDVELICDHKHRPFLLIPKIIGRSAPPLNVAQYFRDYDTDEPSVEETSSLKAQFWSEMDRHPGRLTTFVIERMRDTSRFQTRRIFRDPPSDR